MAVFRIEKNSDFTIMPNYPFRDMRLSFKGRGLLGTMLTLRDDWDYTHAKSLQRHHPTRRRSRPKATSATAAQGTGWGVSGRAIGMR